MDNQIAVAWAAGLIEGEGCLQYRKRKRNGGRSYDWTQSIHVASTDRDVLERLRDILGGPDIYGPYIPTAMTKIDGCIRKPQYTWRVSARADVKRIIELIRPHLLSRRGQKADEVLAGINKRLLKAQEAKQLKA